MASQAPNGAANGAPPTTVANNSGPIDNHDVNDWKNRFNEVLAKPGDVINSSSPADAREYQSSFFGCFNPIDTCKTSPW
jgi:hypothetical protein